MLTIAITPTMLIFKRLDTDIANKLLNQIALKRSDKGYYYVKGDCKCLYETLLQLSYTYDLEII